MLGRDRIEYKTPAQVRAMRRAGLVVADALAAVREAVRPGLTTADLDAVAARVIESAGARPSFLGYHGYPAVLCVSVNEEVVHGIPGGRVLAPGDVVSVDCGAFVEVDGAGWHGDAAFTAVLDPADPADAELVLATEQAMWAGLAAVAVGGRLGDVGAAVEDAVAGRAAIVEGYVGHGIGTAMHQAPEVLNHRTSARGPRLKPGLCVAVEPMLARGTAETDVLDDEWTVVTTDGSRAAHWEHTVALGPAGPWVLTAPDGGRARLAELGVEVAPLD
ncbi:type I methionyl aminopeptidase [Quadrisphaera sp. DSM 44207]|uniref:type I methionyl aminopeptidase n=1 Tax=Quadrisphaera sp. DSM 44207 TaxID=1881057 RepID=UPI0008844C9F|nr:type I methionyl aminopeptidase [Quadrisphaera sp. DSM 44207]SDQ14101.1 methionyl aminopeptidase [Quadrisphaera sp. DSM 44207]